MATDALRSDAFAAQASINVTPLIDVLLVLLMILMLTTPLATKRVPLPLGGDDSGTAPPQDLRLALKSTGELYLDGVAVSRAQLSSALTLASSAFWICHTCGSSCSPTPRCITRTCSQPWCWHRTAV
jgi:biopolymer transport protein ExbD